MKLYIWKNQTMASWASELQPTCTSDISQLLTSYSPWIPTSSHRTGGNHPSQVWLMQSLPNGGMLGLFAVKEPLMKGPLGCWGSSRKLIHVMFIIGIFPYYPLTIMFIIGIFHTIYYSEKLPRFCHCFFSPKNRNFV